MKAIKVPSLGGEAKPEKWIASVELKHIHNGMGHFVVQGKRWEPGRPGPDLTRGILASMAGLGGTPGHWVEYDKNTDAVRIGDVVVNTEP